MLLILQAVSVHGCNDSTTHTLTYCSTSPYPPNFYDLTYLKEGS